MQMEGGTQCLAQTNGFLCIGQWNWLYLIDLYVHFKLDYINHKNIS